MKKAPIEVSVAPKLPEWVFKHVDEWVIWAAFENYGKSVKYWDLQQWADFYDHMKKGRL